MQIRWWLTFPCTQGKHAAPGWGCLFWFKGESMGDAFQCEYIQLTRPMCDLYFSNQVHVSSAHGPCLHPYSGATLTPLGPVPGPPCSSEYRADSPQSLGGKPAHRAGHTLPQKTHSLRTCFQNTSCRFPRIVVALGLDRGIARGELLFSLER